MKIILFITINQSLIMHKYLIFIILIFIAKDIQSQNFQPNYDENKVPDFEIPDPLISFDQKRITNTREWEKIRRPELMEFFSSNVYGKSPGEKLDASYRIVEHSEEAFNEKVNRKQVTVSLENKGMKIDFTILLYLPNHKDKVPVFLGYNFYGNHTITDDPNVIISKAWVRNNESINISNHQLNEESRGVRSYRWAVDRIIDEGFGLATIYYGEVDPDRNNFDDGIHPLFYSRGQKAPGNDEWGSIAAWAYGLSYAMDYLEKDPGIDKNKVIVFGHSRLGKTSLWAGATDQRFAAVISNNSGCGGAALSKRRYGETIKRINTNFPHWFCENFKKYNDNEESLPVDQHELLALIAPRPLYIASAEEDRWADPKGEFLSVFYASSIYELYGKTGITSNEMPPINQPIHNTIGYHIRTGGHDVTDYDWEQYIEWAKKVFGIK